MRDGKYITQRGSEVIVKNGRLRTSKFDWFEEDACDKCGGLYVEINKLFWQCEKCGGGSCDLTHEQPPEGLTKWKGAFKDTDDVLGI
jgi:ribosomal protein L37AE/L43A